MFACLFVCLFICFFLVENFYVYFLEFNNCVCKFDKNKNKNLLKKKKSIYLRKPVTNEANVAM